MAREDWDIRGLVVYMIPADENLYTHEVWDIYEYAEKRSKHIPIDYIFKLLKFSEQRFVDMLNEPVESKLHLITSREEQFREGHAFNKYMVFGYDSDLTVELADFEDWLDDNYTHLHENLAEWAKVPVDPEVARLEAENARLKERIAELEAELAAAKEREAVPMSEENSWLTVYPACAFIKECHERGKSREETTRALIDEGLTHLQAGGLTRDELKFISDVAMKQRVNRMKKE